ncbi:uncharacterized protein LOC6602854 [Drosophila persimilis]|uniref:uncharacterized protein LOC6602854 n=1 Tax=Drosophila persimilis TaxID=7234 RepID=UPI000F078C72|nr:uncharacterized protein LOC6602854 [Drosophila persimilis]
MAMAAMAAKERRPHHLPLVLVLALSVALDLALPAGAAGNDVISSTKAESEHGLIQLDQDIEDAADTSDQSRQSRPHKNIDYDAYANDFNFQEEASIPEDIFDQHDGDIEVTDSQLHYAPAALASPAATDATAGDDDEARDAEDAIEAVWSDVDGSPLWYEDQNEDEAADIILESQRPTTKNCTAYLDAKEMFIKYQNGNSKKKFSEQKQNKGNYMYKLVNNKESQPPKRLPDENEGAAQEAVAGTESAVKFVFAKEAVTESSQDNANFDRKSLRYTKFKKMHEQENQQPEKQHEEQDPKPQDRQEQAHGPDRAKWQGGEMGERRGREEQLFDSIEILNERKFNKPSGQLTLEPEQEKHNRDNKKGKEIVKIVREDEEAIGDIENNFDNDKILEDEGIQFSIDIDESSKKPPPVPTTSTKITPTASRETSKDCEATMSPTIAMIGRKEKRGFFRMYRPDIMAKYFEKFEELDNARENVETSADDDDILGSPVGELHYFDNGGKHQKQPAEKGLMMDPTQVPLRASYLSSSFGLPENGKQQHQESSFADDQTSEQPPPLEPQQDSLGSLEMKRSQSETYMESALQPFQETVPTTTITPTSSTPSSAFERFKALRRSHQKTGHKSHKKRYKDYLKRHHQPEPGTVKQPPPPSLAPRHVQKLLHEQVRERERSLSAPIFALGMRPRSSLSTDKPFYEGRVHYYDHPRLGMEQDQEQQQTTEMERLIAHDNDNWYRRISPVLRNGIKGGQGEQHPVKGHQQHHHHQHQYQHHHHNNHNNHNNQNRQNHHQHSYQKPGQLRQRLSSPYQRKAPAASWAGSVEGSPSSSLPTPPLPPPTQQLGHQITELEHLERYYAKWPHLARVQFQLYDEQRKSQQHPQLYGDYEDDYETAAELEEAQEEHGEEANLPPYIKKYNRRNKQLLNLLEGTLPPPSNPSGNSVWSGSVSKAGTPVTTPVRLDDEYLKQKRRRYHQQHRFEDLFAEQRNGFIATESQETTTITAPTSVTEETSATLAELPSNQLPDDDGYVHIDGNRQKTRLTASVDFWQKEMANKAPRPRPSFTPQSAVTTPKPALFKLPSYPAIASSFLGAPRSRSRSTQFVANVAGRGQSSSLPHHDTSNKIGDGAKGTGEGVAEAAASPLNSFAYHRVVDGIGGNSVLSSGVGTSGANSHKQSRLPFVAITDRRLETMVSKRTLAERHKDFEQNHFPMP